MMDDALGEAVAAAYGLGPIRACVRLDRLSSSVARVEIAERVCWLKLVMCSGWNKASLGSDVFCP